MSDRAGTRIESTVVPAPTARAWLMLWLLCGIYVLNFLDRSLLSILAKPIQDELHLSDGQLGRIGGLYFAFFYCFIAIPVGWLADRTNRVTILALACGIWSAATMACGLAANYGQLVAARMTVGFGEAGGVPPSYAIITDSFPPGRRGIAFGIYNLGPPIGVALGIAFGASIAARFDWRDAFLGIGVIGVAAAIGTKLLLREPTRGAFDGAQDAGAIGPRFWATARMFFSRPILVVAALGSGATQFVTYGLGNFTTLFLMREKGMTFDEVAIFYALAALIGMGGGMLISGKLIDHFIPRGRRVYALAPAWSLIGALPFFLGFLWAPTWPIALLFLTGAMALNYFYLSSAVALVQEEVAPNERVMSGALLLLVMNFIGLGLGPTWVGAASDWLGAQGVAHALQIALLTLAPFYLIASLLFFWLARLIRHQDMQRSQS